MVNRFLREPVPQRRRQRRRHLFAVCFAAAVGSPAGVVLDELQLRATTRRSGSPNTDADGDGVTDHVYGTLERDVVDVTVRTTYAFTRDLTVQAYLQPFVAVGDYNNIRRLALPRTFQFDPVTIAFNPDFNTKSLRGNVVMRWEYKPGSTLFFVWYPVAVRLRRARAIQSAARPRLGVRRRRHAHLHGESELLAQPVAVAAGLHRQCWCMKLPKPRNLIIGIVIGLIVVGMGLVIAQDQETLRVKTSLAATDPRFPAYLAKLSGHPLTSGRQLHRSHERRRGVSGDAGGDSTGARHRVSFEGYIYNSTERCRRASSPRRSSPRRSAASTCAWSSIRFGAKVADADVDRLEQAGCRIGWYNKVRQPRASRK